MSTLSQFFSSKIKSQEFLSSGTFTVPAGVTIVHITACGGGGSGGVSNQNLALGGGSGSYVIRHPVIVTPGDAITVTIGNGGAGASLSSGSPAPGSYVYGNDGGTTSFGSFNLRGGQGGYAISGVGGWDAIGAHGGRMSIGTGYNTGSSDGPGGATGRDVNSPGSRTGQRASGGAGGLFGPGTNAGASSSSSSAGNNSGAGSGGVTTTFDVSSGNGGSGRCIVEWI